MADGSVTKTVRTIARSGADIEMEMLECLNGIRSLARLLQKAHESSEEEYSGVYGTALIIERNAERALKLIGQA